jgi:hypothetical protein
LDASVKIAADFQAGVEVQLVDEMEAWRSLFYLRWQEENPKERGLIDLARAEGCAFVAVGRGEQYVEAFEAVFGTEDSSSEGEQ